MEAGVRVLVCEVGLCKVNLATTLNTGVPLIFLFLVTSSFDM